MVYIWSCAILYFFLLDPCLQDSRFLLSRWTRPLIYRLCFEFFTLWPFQLSSTIFIFIYSTEKGLCSGAQLEVLSQAFLYYMILYYNTKPQQARKKHPAECFYATLMSILTLTPCLDSKPVRCVFQVHVTPNRYALIVICLKTIIHCLNYIFVFWRTISSRRCRDHDLLSSALCAIATLMQPYGRTLK